MNSVLNTDVAEVEQSFGDRFRIISAITKTSPDRLWIQILFDDKTTGHLFVPPEYPCRYLVIYPANRLHLNTSSGRKESVFFTSDPIPAVVERMIRDYAVAGPLLTLGSSYHKDLLKTPQAISIYEQFLEQATRPGDHNGSYRASLTDRASARIDLTYAILALEFDHPDFFWLSHFKSSLGEKHASMECVPCSAADRAQGLRDIDKAVADLISGTTGLADMEKAERIYTRIAKMRTYRRSEPLDYQVLGPIRGQGCCSGYAKLFKIAMNRAGIPCEILYSEDHAWNIAYLSGSKEIYAFDVTFERKKEDQIGRQYFALRIEQMATYKHHTMDEIFKEVLQ